MALLVLKLPPTMTVAPVVVLLCTFRAPLSPDQLEPIVEYVTTTQGTDVKPALLYRLERALVPATFPEPDAT